MYYNNVRVYYGDTCMCVRSISQLLKLPTPDDITLIRKKKLYNVQ